MEPAKDCCGWKKGLYGGGAAHLGTNILVLGPGAQHNSAKPKHRNEVENWCKGGQDHPKSQKPLMHFWTGLEEQAVDDN